MSKPKSKINFYLTDDQMKKVKPLLDKALVAYLKGSRGSVFMQVDKDGQVTGNFIPFKYAKQIGKILEEMS